jgi:RimJ/RimL family protein N-acetyltransferase
MSSHPDEVRRDLAETPAVVTLVTDRLLLRPFAAADAGAFAAATADPAIRRWVYKDGPWDEPAAREWIAAEASQGFGGEAGNGFAAGRNAWFAVAERDGGLVGLLVAKQADWRHNTVEIGYWLAPHARGRGYAVEALRAGCRWLFSLGMARISLLAEPANRASVTVAERAGFVLEGRLRAAEWAGPAGGNRTDLLVFGLLTGEDDQPADPPPNQFPAARWGTRRLLFRPFAESDVPAVLATMTDPLTARWIPVPQPYTRRMAEQWCADTSHQARLTGDGIVWAVQRSDGAGYVGSFSLKRTDWRNLVTEVGYVVAPDARGRGYATEAVSGIAGWVLGRGFARVELRAAAGNTASRRVAEKAGFVAEGVLHNAGFTHRGRVDMVLYARTGGEPGSGPGTIPAEVR